MIGLRVMKIRIMWPRYKKIGKVILIQSKRMRIYRPLLLRQMDKKSTPKLEAYPRTSGSGSRSTTTRTDFYRRVEQCLHLLLMT